MSCITVSDGGVLLLKLAVLLLYDMVAAQLYDMCGVLLLEKGVFL